ncbi:hypothetical protein GR702_01275 [Novosphingobium sp. FGD1]|uniref:Uncharacterized protein n=1 Tax=Novosphingobium silvae TaxID=2692619 RepID=A0A7X4GDT6_9SPHN|nr:PcfJ domain-containing protein [Novosphingobium silvae]MYL96406.1 hypothetical protein [Novosphingobium silvae]
MNEALSPRARAVTLFPNQGMHRNALFLADLHPRAIDYLEQAPVLAASFGVKVNTKADRLYIASRIAGPIQRGERLRSVMAAVAIAGPLRKLKASCIVPYMAEFVRELNDLDPSTLSQAIPEKPGAQRKWLRSLRQYRRRLVLNRASPKRGFAWIARHAQRCGDGQAEDFADYLARHHLADVERWSFERMENEVELWHDRLAANRNLSAYGLGLTPSTLIDLSDWPDHAEVAGFEFFKLATPGMLLEEGARMRHCVASYIPRVMAGDCHIYSVRADMRRMATVEIVGGHVQQLKAFANKAASAAVWKATTAFIDGHCPELANLPKGRAA